MKHFGIVLDNFGPYDLSFSVLKSVNTYQGYSDIILFYENLIRPCINPSASIMHTHDLASYQNPVICTCINTLTTALATIGPTDYYLYAWNLEQLKSGDSRYQFFKNAYTNPLVKIITRGKYDTKILRNNYGANVIAEMPLFAVETVLKIIGEKNES